jgi:hypothetical protein
VASTGGGTTGEGGAVFSGASATTNVPKPAVTTSLSNDTFTANTSKTASVLLTFSSAGTNQTSISNSTMTGNSTSGGSGTIVSFHALSIVQSTITSNTSTTASGGVYLLSSDSVSGSILAGNSGGNCGITSPWAAPTDGGYNLTDPADTSCGFTPANHDLATNPQLGALADNGGPTQTQLPSASSPVVNVIPTGTTTTATDGISGNAITLCGSGATDQRGVARPQGPACDIGAVELVNQAPGLTGPSAATYQVNVAGTPQTFTSTGIPTPTLAETGSLPSGVTFKDNGDGTATLSGTPVLGTTGTYPITITASNGNTPDASLPFTLTVDAPPVLSGPTGARFVVASAGSVSVTATGFPVPTLHEAGTLPAGLTFTDNGNGTATIAGTPAAGSAGHYPVTITATNGVSPDASETLTITVNPAVSITTTSLPAGAVGVTYSTNLAAAGGLSPYTWSITSGSLPPGLTMSPSGAITGSPAGPVTTSTFTVKVVDALRPAGTATRQLTLTIAKGPTSLAVQPVLVHSGVLTVTTASARLTGGSPAVGLQGQTVTFSSGTTKICSGITNTNGNVTCSIPAGDTALLVLRGSITGTYAGSALWKPASGSAGVTT